MFGVHSQRDRGAGTETGQQQAERSRTAVGTAAVDRFVAAQRMACRVDAHTVRRFLTCHRGGGAGVFTVVPHHAILNLCPSAAAPAHCPAPPSTSTPSTHPSFPFPHPA